MSMKRDNKLDNLKSSISILLDALRPEDKLGIIGFSSQAVLIQNPEPVAEKDSIKARLNRMKATGGTNGGAALKMAYALAEEHFIVGGNNQIIIATDGLFGGGDLSRKDMEKLIVTGNGKGIHLSTLGFGFDPKALDFLKHLSDLGGGNHLNPMLEAIGQQGLLEMVKNQSKLP
jgi:Ca-activated chloride channel family protein